MDFQFLNGFSILNSKGFFECFSLPKTLNYSPFIYLYFFLKFCIYYTYVSQKNRMYADSGPGELSAHLASTLPLPDRGGAAQTGAGRGGLPSHPPLHSAVLLSNYNYRHSLLQLRKRSGQLTNHQRQREVVYPL